MDKKISAFIESKAEIQELLARHPEKKRKLFGFILTCCVDVKMSQLLGIFLESSVSSSNMKVWHLDKLLDTNAN